MVGACGTFSIKTSNKFTSTGSFAMFSDHLPKINQTAGSNLFVIAGALVIVCQLVAMVLVADGQVKKAEVRESQMQSQRQAVVKCLENAQGAELSTCTTRVHSDNRQVITLNQVNESSEGFRRPTRRSSNDDLMPMSFAAR